MMGRSVNICQLMLDEMSRTRFQRDSGRFFYGNLLTKYMLRREVPLYDGADEVVPVSIKLLDISALQLQHWPKLSTIVRQE